MRPNRIPLAISCLHYLFSVAQSATSVRILNTRGIEYPSFRFRPYSTLDENTINLAQSLGYDESSWNALGNNPWEIYSFNTIESDGSSMVVDSIEAMGFTEEVWDCYMNHYRDFTWQQLADVGVVVFAVVLGWSETMWDGMTSAPETEFLLWDKLSTGQQQAAVEFCFTQEIWDQVNLEDWDSTGTHNNPSTGSEGSSPIAPVASPIAPPTMAPSKPRKTVTKSPVADKSSPAPVVEESAAPVDRPTMSPTAQLNIPESAKPTSMGSLETAEPTQPQQTNANGVSSIPPVDDIRYVTWGKLQEDKKSLAEDLGYDQDTWNTPGTADIEYYSIQGLYDADLNDAPDKISELGFSDEQWDCYVHHYISYSWEQLVEVGVDSSFIALGWTQPSWDGETKEVPASEGKTWDELTDEERAGAAGLCYTIQTWDGYSLDDDAWNTIAEGTQKPEQGDNPTGTAESRSSGRNTQIGFSVLLVAYVSTTLLF